MVERGAARANDCFLTTFAARCRSGISIFGRCNYTTLCDDTFPRTLGNQRSIV